MKSDKALSLSLLCLRVSVFVVMLVWTLDKFFHPGHAATVYKVFYHLPGLQAYMMTLIGAVELVIIIGFVLGFQKRLTYGAVLIFHLISTVSSYKQFITPYHGNHLLFFASIPMLAACLGLYLLRDKDTTLVVSKS